jgi:hypothetical protein
MLEIYNLFTNRNTPVLTLRGAIAHILTLVFEGGNDNPERK